MVLNRPATLAWILTITASSGLAGAAIGEEQAGERSKPLIEKISPDVYRIGKISLNKQTREITIPACTNITDPETIIEYLLIHDNGEKIHESLLTTQADPTHVNIAFKLLNYKESPELFRERKADGSISDKYPVVGEQIKQAARFSVNITWKESDTQKTIPVTQWIHNQASKRNMHPVPWIYNGSYIYEKRFNAKLTGSIIAIYPDIGAIANYSGDDREDDTLWTPSPETPEEGTPVKVVLKPWRTVP
jgi:hypothetical protein